MPICWALLSGTHNIHSKFEKNPRGKLHSDFSLVCREYYADLNILLRTISFIKFHDFVFFRGPPTNSPLPLFVLVRLLVDLDDLPLGVLLGPEDVGVGRGAHPADNVQFINVCTTYRAEKKSSYVLLRNSQAEIFRNHAQRFFLNSVQSKSEIKRFLWTCTLRRSLQLEIGYKLKQQHLILGGNYFKGGSLPCTRAWRRPRDRLWTPGTCWTRGRIERPGWPARWRFCICTGPHKIWD